VVGEYGCYVKSCTCLEIRGGDLKGKDDGDFLVGFEEKAIDVDGA